MMEPTTGAAARRTARIAGAFYLLTIVAGIAGFAASGALGDALTVAGSLAYVVVTLLLYAVLKPVDPVLSLVAAAFSLVGCALGVLEALHHPMPAKSIVFFGPYCLLLGYLVFRSGFMPKLIGVLLALTGVGWLTYASPWILHHVPPFQMFTGLLGEGALTFWLLVYGVDETRWAKASM